MELSKEQQDKIGMWIIGSICTFMFVVFVACIGLSISHNASQPVNVEVTK